MVTEGSLDKLVEWDGGPEKRPLRVALFLQGGGRRGAATCGMLYSLLRYTDIEVIFVSGTSAGGMAGAVAVHGLAKEQSDPQHDRQDTRLLVAALYKTIADMRAYTADEFMETAKTMAEVSTGRYAPHHAVLHVLGAWGRAAGALFQPLQLGRVLSGEEHVLQHLLRRVIGNTDFINSPLAPFFAVNAVREADDAHVLITNRNGMPSLRDYARTGALTAFLQPIDGYRDGAQGGANPAIADPFDLYLSQPGAVVPDAFILYNLSDPSEGKLDLELAARPQQLHAHFMAAQKRQQREWGQLQRRFPKIPSFNMTAALTPAQRAEGLSDTDPKKLAAMFEIGRKQGEELAVQLQRVHASLAHGNQPKSRRQRALPHALAAA